MRVNVDGGKYTICSDDATGRLWVERGDCKDWMVNPAGGKMLLSAAYELACLRQIVKRTLKIVDSISGPETACVMQGCLEIRDLAKSLEGYTDFKRNLNDPPDL
jgi:hypothetical protein